MNIKSMIPTFFIVAAFSCLIVKTGESDVSKSLPEGITSISSLDFKSPGEDLHLLSSIVGDAEIVGLGEGAHTSGGYHAAMARMAKHLIKEMGFREIMMETPWQAAETLNKQLQDCRKGASLHQGLQMLFAVYASQELHELFKWVHEFNCSGNNKKVTFNGYDIEWNWRQHEGPYDHNVIYRYVQANIVDLQERLDELDLCGPKCKGKISSPSNLQQLERCLKFLNDLEAFKYQDNSRLDSAIISLRHLAAMTLESGRNASDSRDSAMAKLIKKQKSLRKKTILLGHLAHFVRNGAKMNPFANITMGEHLDKTYGKNYRVIGVISRKNEVLWDRGDGTVASDNSLEIAFENIDPGNLLVDLKKSNFPIRGKAFQINRNENVRARLHFDGLVILPLSVAMSKIENINYPTVFYWTK